MISFTSNRQNSSAAYNINTDINTRKTLKWNFWKNWYQLPYVSLKYFLESEIIFPLVALLIAYILANAIQWYRKFCRVKKFYQQYTTLNLFHFFNPENDDHVKQRFFSI